MDRDQHPSVIYSPPLISSRNFRIIAPRASLEFFLEPIYREYSDVSAYSAYELTFPKFRHIKSAPLFSFFRLWSCRAELSLAELFVCFSREWKKNTRSWERCVHHFGACSMHRAGDLDHRAMIAQGPAVCDPAALVKSLRPAACSLQLAAGRY